MERAVEFLKTTAQMLVENPDAVEVESKIDGLGVLLRLKVDPADMGRILGKSGARANALRVLLKAIGAQEKERVSLAIYDPKLDEEWKDGDNGR